MVARVNGEEWSRGELADLHHRWGDLIAHASRDTRLRPGDVIGSGTVGTGCILELGLVHGRDRYPYLVSGDEVELEVDGHRRAPQPHRLIRPRRAYGPPMASTELASVAPAFVEMAHRIVWCTVGHRQPRWGGRRRASSTRSGSGTATRITGWILTSPNSPKARHLDANPRVSLTYWTANHDTCSADCDTAWELSPEERQAGWDRFLHGPAPVGYDPKIIPPWTDPRGA